MKNVHTQHQSVAKYNSKRSDRQSIYGQVWLSDFHAIWNARNETVSLGNWRYGGENLGALVGPNGSGVRFQLGWMGFEGQLISWNEMTTNYIPLASINLGQKGGFGSWANFGGKSVEINWPGKKMYISPRGCLISNDRRENQHMKREREIWHSDTITINLSRQPYSGDNHCNLWDFVWKYANSTVASVFDVCAQKKQSLPTTNPILTATLTHKHPFA